MPDLALKIPAGKQASISALTRLHARRRWAKVAWVYGLLIAVVTVMLGTFVVAFLASLKDNPLEQPFRFNFAQVQPANWKSAYQLGEQGNNAPWFGGFAPGAEVTFHLTYATDANKSLTIPVIEVPRRTPGTGMAAAITKDFSADYALVSEPVLLNKAENVTFIEKQGKRDISKQGHSATWQFVIRYQGEGLQSIRYR